MSASMAPLPGVSEAETTSPRRTVTSYTAVAQGPERRLSVPHTARARDAEPQREVNSPTEPTGRAYWL